MGKTFSTMAISAHKQSRSRPLRSPLWAIAILLTATGCANSSSSEALQRSFAADPQLQASPAVFGGASANSPTPNPVTQLDADIPADIPRYPNAKLVSGLPIQDKTIFPASQTASTATTVAVAKVTRWNTPDSVDAIRNFYQQTFQSQGWERLSRTPTSPPDSLVAQRDGLQVIVTTPPRQLNNFRNFRSDSSTEFTIHYLQLDLQLAPADGGAIAQASPSPSPSATDSPQPGNPDFIGPILPGASPSSGLSTTPSPAVGGASPVPTATAQTFSDLSKAPQQLRPYIQDLANLGVLVTETSSGNSKTAAGQPFEPNKPITRREFARWLVAANNRLNATRPARQLRLAVETAQPSFRDVPRNDADFAAIQGLAEAGILPSALSGDLAAVLFRPDTPLTREVLLAWKVPLDLRQKLPLATLDAVQQTWGFQDTARIDPLALRAVLADYQNGDQANIRRAFGFTTLLQPKRSVTRAEAAATLWYFGMQGDGVSAAEAKTE